MVKVLVPISGGKDSQACLELALAHHDRADIRGLFCDTQFEHPWTYEHVHWMRGYYGIRIDRVTGGSVLEKSIKYGRFPGGGARHCTDELKIRETKLYCKRLAEQQGSHIANKKRGVDASDVGGFEVWYGMRSAESPERERRYAGKLDTARYLPHEVMPSKYPQYLGRMGVRFVLPVLDWSAREIFELIGLRANPLYETFDRVGCFPCQAAGDAHKEKAYAFDDFGRKQYRIVKIVAEQIGKPMFNSKGGRARDAAQCLVCSE